MAGTTKAGALARVSQLLALEARDRVRRPRSTAGLPRSPAEISPEWLTSVLCPGGVRVVSVSRSQATAGTSSRQTLQLTYDPPGSEGRLPARLFVKSTSTLGQRLMLGLGGLIDREPSFYEHIRPLLRIEAPRGYFGAVNPRTWHSIVLLEDVIHTRGATFWKPAFRLSRAQAEDLIENMASWHGHLWESPRLAGWRWLRTPGDQMGVIDSLLGLADRTRAGARRARQVTPPSLGLRRADLHEGLRRSMHLASAGPHTYLHGDLHVANTYLTRQGRIGVCDWQVGLRGSWAHDYGYLLATMLTVEDRRAWERELLAHYLDRLAAAGAPPPTPEAAWLAYRRSLFYPYFAWVYTLGRSRLQPAFQPEEVSLTMVGRIAAAIEDLGARAAVGL